MTSQSRVTTYESRLTQAGVKLSRGHNSLPRHAPFAIIVVISIVDVIIVIVVAAEIKDQSSRVGNMNAIRFFFAVASDQ